MWERGIIEPSASPYNSPLVVVAKRDGSLRLCLDFRALNEQIPADNYPIPAIDSILSQLAGNTLFSTLDLREGYHQLPLDPASRPATAFTTPEGRWQYR